MGQIILVTGGVRSGKSSFAERRAARCAAESGTAVAYIATAQIYDAEMQLRVDLHQSRRPADWTTYEAPFSSENAIREAGKAHGVILFDCVTMFLSNDMLQYSEEEQERDSFARHVEARINALICAAEEADATTIFVTNEVGDGSIGIWRGLPISSSPATRQRSISSPAVFLLISKNWRRRCKWRRASC